MLEFNIAFHHNIMVKRRGTDSMGHGGMCPPLSLMAGHGGTVSRTSNKK